MEKSMIKTLFFLILILLVASCKKAEEDIVPTTHATVDNAFAGRLFNDIFAQVHKSSTEEFSLYKFNNDVSNDVCLDTVIVSSSSFPKTLILDYGSDSINVCSDGNNRRGIITATYTGNYIDEKSVISITLKNYYVNDVKVEGTITVTNKGRNSNDNLYYSFEVKQGKITEKRTTISWSAKWTREWIEGESSSLIPFSYVDDVFAISGKSNGRNSKGNTFTSTITTPLRIEMNCDWIISGEEEVNPNNLSTRFVDYGSNACDSKAAITIRGMSYEVDLR